MQSRLSSLIEAIVNVAVGFIVSVIITALIFPGLSFGENLRITLIFTAASIARSYAVRRVFNYRASVRRLG